jgi:uncharacterized protein YecT (DUF1311 family)
MKHFFLVSICFFAGYLAHGQNNEPRDITPQILEKLKAEVERDVPAFRKKIQKNYWSNDQMEFAVDTFRIQRLLEKRMHIDYTTMGMNTTVEEMGKSYDVLLNKYYKKLKSALQPEDQKTLVTAQKAWLAYREAESKLIITMTADQYSGGGTIQSNISVGSITDLLVVRTLEIFNYYDRIEK